VAFSPDGSQVITLDTDSSTTPTSSHLYVHNVNSPTALRSVALTSGWALGVSPVATAGALPVAVTTTTGNTLVYTLTSTGLSAPTTLKVTSDQSYAETAQFSPAGTLLATGGDEGILQFWPLPLTGSQQAPTINVNTVTNGNSDWVDVVAFSPDGSELAIGAGYFGSVTTYAAASRAHTGNEQDTSNNYDVSSLGYSPNGKWIIGGEADCGCVFLCQH
jgi:WD40 repeat protein